MRLDLFFNGKLGREEMSSAFLATLLDQRDDFRDFFLKETGCGALPGSCEVRVEIDNVDVRLDCGAANTVVLVEVKVRGASVRPEQLSAYYCQIRRTAPEKRIVVVMVVPSTGTGKAEIARVRQCPDWRVDDHTSTITWKSLASFTVRISKYDRDELFIRSGFETVTRIIADKGREKYAATGGRGILQELARRIASGLEEEVRPVRFRVWTNRDMFDVYPVDTPFTVSVRLWVDPPPDAQGVPVHPITDDAVQIRVETMVGLSDKGKKNGRVREAWQAIRKSDTLVVGSGVVHERKGRWYCTTTKVCGSVSEVEGKTLALVRPLLAEFGPLMVEPYS
jgi:hypothetical protein